MGGVSFLEESRLALLFNISDVKHIGRGWCRERV